MTFTPRIFDTILEDMILHVRSRTTVTDFSIGSVVRTILEASALEDDEQYHQMVQLVDGYSFNTASGTDLDERLADFNIDRLEAAASAGNVKIGNDNLTQSDLQFDAASAAISITVEDSSDFPISGYPYTIRIGEGLPQVEDVSVSNNNTVTNIFTVSALSNDHTIGEVVAIVSGSDREVASGTVVQVPAQGDNLPISFQMTEKATIIAGNYNSNLVSIRSTESGSINNVGASRITQFTGSPPFVGAVVTNPTATSGGRDRETDRDYVGRAKQRLQVIGRGTIRAIEGAIKGLEDPDTGQRVVTTKLLENYTDEHKLYIDDGTGFIPSKVIMARTELNGAHGIGLGALTVDDVSEFPAAGFVLVSPEDSAQAEVLEYTSKNSSTNVLTLNGLTTSSHNTNDEVLLVNKLDLAEEGQNFFKLTNYPIQRGSFEIYDNSSGAYRLRTFDTDYLLNKTNGDIEYYGTGLTSGSQVVANFTYYTGLFALAQKVINGDRNDPVNYPGVAAGGVIIHVDTPVIRSISIIITVSVENGYDEEELRDDAQLAIENYIDGLAIGDNVILAEMIERVMSIEGMTNAKIQSPTADVVILEDELPRSYDILGNSLVTVL